MIKTGFLSWPLWAGLITSGSITLDFKLVPNGVNPENLICEIKLAASCSDRIP